MKLLRVAALAMLRPAEAFDATARHVANHSTNHTVDPLLPAWHIADASHAGGGAPGPAPGPAAVTLSPCPGPFGSPCHDHGACMKNGVCWCEVGWGGVDCGTEAPLFLEIPAVGPLELQDMKGIYKADGFFLMQEQGSLGAGLARDNEAKYMYYDQNAGGWAVSKFDSPCTDDICAFGYQPNRKQWPNPKGYVFGNENLHIYYKQLIWDGADLDPGEKRGYYTGFSYTHDPQIIGMKHDMTEFNGMYTLQPRYTHQENGKYAIFPTDLKNEGKRWVAMGHMGSPRKWKVIAAAIDPTPRRYFAPLVGWVPDGIFDLSYSCVNHLHDDTCALMETTCLASSSDTPWIRACCRNTCGACELSRYACVLDRSNPVVTKLAALNRTVQLRAANVSENTAIPLSKIRTLQSVEAKTHTRQARFRGSNALTAHK